MILFLILVITELYTFVVIRQHFKDSSKLKYFIFNLFNAVLSIYLWIVYYRVISYRGFYDDPEHVWLRMILSGTLAAVLFPRVILNICHFTGVIIMLRKGGHLRKLTRVGFISASIIFAIILFGSVYGKLNFRTEEVTIKIKDLNPALNGLTIGQLSDLHLSGFHKHKRELKKIIDRLNYYKPDILINSGDFVSFGWREFEQNDTILRRVSGKYGSFAVLGNHDMGTYDPDLNSAERDTNVMKIQDLIRASGLTILNDTNNIVKVGKAKVAISGVTTSGRHPKMIHGNLRKALQGTDSADFRILISHDPNHWDLEVKGKTNVELTLSGHTHGMQMGIFSRYFKWSPSKYFYPKWGGLYSSGNQFLYVNRGLGVLAIPFRIWMPPEITIIRLSP
jgi:uncharacterized protein